MDNGFTINSIDPVTGVVDVTFVVGGVKYTSDVGNLPMGTPDSLTKALTSILQNMQSRIDLSSVISEQSYSVQELDGSVVPILVTPAVDPPISEPPVKEPLP